MTAPTGTTEAVDTARESPSSWSSAGTLRTAVLLLPAVLWDRDHRGLLADILGAL